MKNTSTLRLILLVICGASIANQLILFPVLHDWGPDIGDALQNFFGITLMKNFEVRKEILPPLVAVAVNYLQIAGLVIGLGAGKNATPAASTYAQWGVAQQPTSYSPPPPPPPPAP